MRSSKRVKRDQDSTAVDGSRARKNTKKRGSKSKEAENKGNGKQKREASPGSDDSGSFSEYEVEGIEGHKVTKDGQRLKFWVRWKNYSSDDNTLEGFEFFAKDAPERAQKYLTKVFSKF